MPDDKLVVGQIIMGRAVSVITDPQIFIAERKCADLALPRDVGKPHFRFALSVQQPEIPVTIQDAKIPTAGRATNHLNRRPTLGLISVLFYHSLGVNRDDFSVAKCQHDRLALISQPASHSGVEPQIEIQCCMLNQISVFRFKDSKLSPSVNCKLISLLAIVNVIGGAYRKRSVEADLLEEVFGFGFIWQIRV